MIEERARLDALDGEPRAFSACWTIGIAKIEDAPRRPTDARGIAAAASASVPEMTGMQVRVVMEPRARWTAGGRSRQENHDTAQFSFAHDGRCGDVRADESRDGTHRETASGQVPVGTIDRGAPRRAHRRPDSRRDRRVLSRRTKEPQR